MFVILYDKIQKFRFKKMENVHVKDGSSSVFVAIPNEALCTAGSVSINVIGFLKRVRLGRLDTRVFVSQMLNRLPPGVLHEKLVTEAKVFVEDTHNTQKLAVDLRLVSFHNQLCFPPLKRSRVRVK